MYAPVNADSRLRCAGALLASIAYFYVGLTKKVVLAGLRVRNTFRYISILRIF